MTKPEPLNPAQLQELVQAIKEAEAELAEYEYPWGRDRLRERKDEYTEYCLTHASDIAARCDEVVKMREALEECIYKSDEPTTVELIARQALGDTP
jgi:UDP-glucose 6-dehydrogenase